MLRQRKKQKSGNASEKSKKGRPKVPQAEGCTVADGWTGDKHSYMMFGAPKECCVKCGKENAMITGWRRQIADPENDGPINWDHPYVQCGYWSHAEYKKAMSRK